MLRAICQIAYRYLNDDDYFYEGYGCETAGPSHAFLVSVHCPIAAELQKILSNAVGKEDDKYEAALVPAIEAVVTYVEGRADNYTSNDVDSRECKSHYTYRDDIEDEDIW